MLTAKSEIDDKVLGLDSGADDYLTKPFVTKELLARIRALTRREKGIIDSKLVFGNINLCCVNYELSSIKGSFSLTNKEYQIMEMLLGNTGRYISQLMLVQSPMGIALIPMEN